MRESNIPFLVEARDWARLPERFHREIEREHAVLSDPLLPVDWPVLTLRDAGVRLIDCVHKTPIAQESGYPYIGIPQMKTGRLDFESARKISHEDFLDWTKKAKPQPHDVILSRRTNPGVTAIDRTGTEFALGQNLVLLRADGSRVNPAFLKWLVQSPAWWREIRKFMNVGAVFDSLKCADVPNFELPIPPLPVQLRIAALLDALDEKIELNRGMNETLEAMARALFKSWFVDFEPVRAKMEGEDTGLPGDIANLFPNEFIDSPFHEIPIGWKLETLGSIVALNPESWKLKNRPNSVVYVDLKNTKRGHIEKRESYSWEDAPSRARRVLRRSDTIIGTVRPGNESYALVDEDGLTGSTAFAVLRPHALVDREVVWCASTANENIQRLAHLADGGAYPAVRPEAVSATPVVLADIEVRKAFSRVVGPLLDQVSVNKRESNRLACLRDTLLPELVSGEIRLPQTEQAMAAIEGNTDA